MFRRMEDRIRNLCRELVATSDPAQQVSIVTKLRSELHRHMERLRLRLGEYPLEERRARNSVPFDDLPLESPPVDRSAIRVVVIQDRRRNKDSPTYTETKKSKSG
jgi:hypothetical protein